MKVPVLQGYHLRKLLGIEKGFLAPGGGLGAMLYCKYISTLRLQRDSNIIIFIIVLNYQHILLLLIIIIMHNKPKICREPKEARVLNQSSEDPYSMGNPI